MAGTNNEAWGEVTRVVSTIPGIRIGTDTDATGPLYSLEDLQAYSAVATQCGALAIERLAQDAKAAGIRDELIQTLFAQAQKGSTGESVASDPSDFTIEFDPNRTLPTQYE